ncbi:hypothetical protein BKA64DRAFT_63748 [Cadophora sp. MPI-SDFR-AT-0126]|nr:hypothetical protein BKA64DRAFT_63748 [Leotiomycetes sp. MPI-SDFR-AT-0126]
MESESSPAPGDSTGILSYLSKLDLYKAEKPYRCSIDPWHVPNAKVSNIVTTACPVEINNIRDHEVHFTTDIHGFELWKHATSVPLEDFKQDEEVPAKYLSECEALLKDHFRAFRVHVFNHAYRNAEASRDLGYSLEEPRLLPPALFAHVDQTEKGARMRVMHHLPTEALPLLKSRFRIINIWRPLMSPVQDHALAVCDYRSTDRADYVATDIVSPSYQGEQYSVYHNESHRWWYADSMREDEIVFLKCYDSLAENDPSVARCCPHSSFEWYKSRRVSKPRRSIEIRALVFS